MSDRIREILSCYPGENPGVLTTLARKDARLGLILLDMRRRAEELEKLQHPAPKHTSRGKIFGLLLVPLVAVLAWNVWDLNRPPRPMEPEAQQASLSGVVYVLAQQLEAYHVRNGAYQDWVR